MIENSKYEIMSKRAGVDGSPVQESIPNGLMRSRVKLK